MSGNEQGGIEFPQRMIDLVRCSRDGGILALSDAQNGKIGIVRGTLSCQMCGAKYFIADGILRLLTSILSTENQNEMMLRDSEYARSAPGVYQPASSGWRSPFSDQIEVAPHMKALGNLNNQKVLEMGCGDGRFTIPMAQMGAEVIAVDFSLTGLYRMGAYLNSGIAPTTYKVKSPKITAGLGDRVGMVQADASQLCVTPESFDRALSATPLDSREERMTMYRTIADGLKDSGRFVGGVEHDDPTRRILGEPVAKRYTEGGVFVEHFDKARMQREAAPYFDEISIRPIRPRIPLVKDLPLPIGVTIARTAAALPIVRQLGEILLMTAEKPVRPPVEGKTRRGIPVAKKAYALYRRRRYGARG